MRAAFIYVDPEDRSPIGKSEYPLIITNDFHDWARDVLGADYFRGGHLNSFNLSVLEGYDLFAISLFARSLDVITALKMAFPNTKIVGLQDGSADDFERAYPDLLGKFYKTLKCVDAVAALNDQESILMHWRNLAQKATVEFLPPYIPTHEIKKAYAPPRQRIFSIPSILVTNAPSRGKGFFLNVEFIRRALGKTKFTLYCQSANKEDDELISDWWLRGNYDKDKLLLYRTMPPEMFWRVLSGCAMAVSFDYWYTSGRISGDAACVGTYCVGSDRTFLQNYLFPHAAYDPIRHIDRIFLLAECLRFEGLEGLYENHGMGEVEEAGKLVEEFNLEKSRIRTNLFLEKIL